MFFFVLVIVSFISNFNTYHFLQVCVRRRSMCVGNPQPSTSSGSWCSPPERRWRWGRNSRCRTAVVIMCLFFWITTLSICLSEGSQLRAFNSFHNPGSGCGVVRQTEARRLHRLLQQKRHLLHQQTDWGQRTRMCRHLRELTSRWVCVYGKVPVCQLWSFEPLKTKGRYKDKYSPTPLWIFLVPDFVLK